MYAVFSKKSNWMSLTEGVASVMEHSKPNLCGPELARRTGGGGAGCF